MSEKMKMIIGAVVFVVPMVICVAIGIDSGMLLFGIGFACLMIYGFFLYRYENSDAGKKKQAEIEAEKKYIESLATYNEVTGELTRHARASELSQVVKVEERKDYTVKHEPTKLHVGAVTVGGVTTGGAYTTGNYNYISNSKKNGLCNLVYIPKNKPIKQIILTEELYELAKKSNIAEYLSDKKIVVIESVTMSYFEQQNALNNLSNTGYVGNQAANAGQPTLEKGHRILNWLTCR